jgi:hypothetical protein
VSQLAQIKAGKRNIKIIDYPGVEGQQVALRVLSNQEIQDAVFSAEQLFKEQGFDVSRTNQDAYDDERSTQILARALREAENPNKPFAASAKELRGLLEKEEKELLLQEYTDFEQACSPRINKMSEKEFEELWQSLKKSPQLSSVLNSSTLSGLITYLASRPANLPTDSGSIS